MLAVPPIIQTCLSTVYNPKSDVGLFQASTANPAPTHVRNQPKSTYPSKESSHQRRPTHRTYIYKAEQKPTFSNHTCTPTYLTPNAGRHTNLIMELIQPAPTLAPIVSVWVSVRFSSPRQRSGGMAYLRTPGGRIQCLGALMTAVVKNTSSTEYTN